MADPNKEPDFYRSLGVEMPRALQDAYRWYKEGAPEKPALRSNIAEYNPNKMYTDHVTGEEVSGAELKQRDAIRSKQAALKARRGVYGQGAQYSALPDEDGAFGYLGNQSPYSAPDSNYGVNLSPEQKLKAMGASVSSFDPSATFASVIPGAAAGDAAVRNVKEFVSISDIPAIKQQVLNWWEPNDRWGREQKRNSTYMEYADLDKAPMPYDKTEALGTRHRILPDGTVEYVPNQHPRLSSQHEWYQLPEEGKLNPTRSQFTNMPDDMFATDSDALKPDWLRGETDVVGRKPLPRHYKRFVEEPASLRRQMLYQVSPMGSALNPNYVRYPDLPPGDYQFNGVPRPTGISDGDFPFPPELDRKPDTKFPGPKQGVDVDRRGLVRGAVAGLAADAAVPLGHEATSVPTQYVRDALGGIDQGAYGIDLQSVPPESRKSYAANAISMLNYGLPSGYFGSEQHKREERLSNKVGAPLTEEVKIARQLMKLAAYLTPEESIKGIEPDAQGAYADDVYKRLQHVIAGVASGALAG